MFQRISRPAFLNKSLEETRKIRSAISALEIDIEMLHEEEIEENLAYTGEFDREFFKDDDYPPIYNEDCLEELIEEHFQYQDYITHNLRHIRKFVHERNIRRYFDAVNRFDLAVHRINPAYPAPR